MREGSEKGIDKRLDLHPTKQSLYEMSPQTLVMWHNGRVRKNKKIHLCVMKRILHDVVPPNTSQARWVVFVKGHPVDQDPSHVFHD